MNYIGSKLSLLPNIERLLDENGVPNSGIALDLFAGTGAVAQRLKQRGHITYANDWQCYSYLTCVAYLEHSEMPTFSVLLDDHYWQQQILDTGLLENLPLNFAEIADLALLHGPARRVTSYLNQLPGKSGLFYQTYCEGRGRWPIILNRTREEVR